LSRHLVDVRLLELAQLVPQRLGEPTRPERRCCCPAGDSLALVLVPEIHRSRLDRPVLRIERSANWKNIHPSAIRIARHRFGA
jgi:hypothetical protein